MQYILTATSGEQEREVGFVMPIFLPYFFKSSPNLNALGISSLSASLVWLLRMQPANLSSPLKVVQARPASPQPAFCLKFPVPAPARPPTIHCDRAPASEQIRSKVGRRGLGRSRLWAAAALQRRGGWRGRYSAGPPSKPRPGTALVQRRTCRPPHTRNPEWAVRPPPPDESDQLWKSLTQQRKLGSGWILAQRQISTWSTRKFCPRPAEEPVEATAVVTTRPVCQLLPKLEFWPPEKAWKVSEGLEKTKRQQFSRLVDTSGEPYWEIRVTIRSDWWKNGDLGEAGGGTVIQRKAAQNGR